MEIKDCNNNNNIRILCIFKNRIVLLMAIKTIKLYISVKCKIVFIYYPYYNSLGCDRFRMPRGGNLFPFLSIQKGVKPRVFKTKSLKLAQEILLAV